MIHSAAWNGLRRWGRQVLRPGGPPAVGGGHLRQRRVHVHVAHHQQRRTLAGPLCACPPQAIGEQPPHLCITNAGTRTTKHSADHMPATTLRRTQQVEARGPRVAGFDSIDAVDTIQQRSLGGARYHIDHPGGLNPESFPINALEGESRRAGRFFRMGHTGGVFQPRTIETSPDFPFTLDLRRQ